MPEFPNYVKDVLAQLEAAGHQAWCVGGCVRDMQRGRTPEDWDVTTGALPEETAAVFPGKTIPTGLQHGTVTVLSGGERVEVTTFRTDGPYRDHRRPERVAFTRSLDEDLARRDFTVNAMAMDLRGQLRDPFGGREDLAAGVLRCVGDPARRFEEDALRILRGLRFAACLGLRPEAATAAALHGRRALLADIAPERMYQELTKLLCGDWAGGVLEAFPDVLGVFWPELLPMVGLDQQNHHHCYDVWEHTIHAVEAVEPLPVLRYAALLHDVGKPGCMTVDDRGCGHFLGHPAAGAALAESMLRRLKCETALRERVVRLVTWHDRPISPTDRAVRRCLRRLGEEELRLLLAVKRADNLAQAPAFHGRQQELDQIQTILERLLEEDACFSLKQLAVGGRELVALGYQGPTVGRVLEALLDAVVEGTLPNEPAALLEYARRVEIADRKRHHTARKDV